MKRYLKLLLNNANNLPLGKMIKSQILLKGKLSKRLSLTTKPALSKIVLTWCKFLTQMMLLVLIVNLLDKMY